MSTTASPCSPRAERWGLMQTSKGEQEAAESLPLCGANDLTVGVRTDAARHLADSSLNAAMYAKTNRGLPHGFEAGFFTLADPLRPSSRRPSTGLEELLPCCKPSRCCRGRQLCHPPGYANLFGSCFSNARRMGHQSRGASRIFAAVAAPFREQTWESSTDYLGVTKHRSLGHRSGPGQVRRNPRMSRPSPAIATC